MLTWIDGMISRGMSSVASRAVRVRNETVLIDAVMHVDVVRALVADRSLPAYLAPVRVRNRGT